MRAHEAAHQAASAGMAGAASFSYATGPDGQRYAIGGEVPISAPKGMNAQQEIQIAQTIRAAALAPSDPSGQDLAVAASATAMESTARSQAVAASEPTADKGAASKASGAHGASPTLRARPAPASSVSVYG